MPRGRSRALLERSRYLVTGALLGLLLHVIEPGPWSSAVLAGAFFAGAMMLLAEIRLRRRARSS